MDEEILRADPHSKRKKIAIAIFVGVIGLLAIVAFLIFGLLVKDYIIFDANRIQAANELTMLNSRIKEMENRLYEHRASLSSQLKTGKDQLQELDELIHKRNAQIDSQQRLIAEYDELMKKIDLAKKEYQSTLGDIKLLRESAAKEMGVITALKKENEILEAQKSALNKELAELDKAKKSSNQSIEDLARQLRDLSGKESIARAEFSELQEALTETSANLAIQNNKIESARRSLSILEQEISEMKLNHDTLSAQIILAQETFTTRTADKEKLIATVSGLTQKKIELSSEIALLEERKLGMESQTKALDIKIKQTNERLQAISQKVETDKAND
ncbi:MAG: hypothetical protein C4548_13135 [Desulfobacteraceae bacterium]|nr:MAG: hypothetical protein C4548_13135 [Desulfobacteraceae bacterium]